jgi:hypothetical protein
VVTGWNGEGTEVARNALLGRSGSGRLVLLVIAVVFLVVGIVGHNLIVTIGGAVATALALGAVVAAVRRRLAVRRLQRRR